MGTNRLSHSNGPPDLPGPYIPHQALLGSVSSPPSDAGHYLYDASLGEYFVSDPTGSFWVKTSVASPQLIALVAANTLLARAAMTVITYDTSVEAKTLVLPSAPQVGDRIDFVAIGTTGEQAVGQVLAHSLVVDPAGKSIYGASTALSLDKAVQNFQLYFDGAGWW